MRTDSCIVLSLISESKQSVLWGIIFTLCITHFYFMFTHPWPHQEFLRMAEFKEQGHCWPLFWQIWLHTSLKVCSRRKRSHCRPECSLQCLCLLHCVWQLLMSLCDMSYSLSTHRCKNILYAESANDLKVPLCGGRSHRPLNLLQHLFPT